MNVNQMRVALDQKYKPGFSARMSDNQVIAIYRRLQSKNKI